MRTAFIFQSAFLCTTCGERRRNRIAALGHIAASDYENSDYYPQLEYLSESNFPEHCDHCNEFLMNPLTDAGREYVRYKVQECGGPPTDWPVWDWSDYYGIPFEEPEEE